MVRHPEAKTSVVPLASGKATAGGIRSPEDRLNQDIIRMLQEDGRIAFSEIAQKLNVSEGTVRNRVNGLKAANQLRIVAIVDPVASEYQSDAVLGLRMASQTTPQAVADDLSTDPRVVYIMWVAGRFDLIVEVVAEGREDLQDFLENRIYAAAGIADVEVMLGIKNYKNQFLLKRNWKNGDE